MYSFTKKMLGCFCYTNTSTSTRNTHRLHAVLIELQNPLQSIRHNQLIARYHRPARFLFEIHIFDSKFCIKPYKIFYWLIGL